MMVFKNGIDESDLPCCPNSSLEKGEGGGLSLSSSLRQSTISHSNGDLGEIGLGCGKCENQQNQKLILQQDQQTLDQWEDTKGNTRECRESGVANWRGADGTK